MKKITKFIAGFSAAAALLLGVGCTNQADYVEDNTARNACNIEGLYVEGLDKAYDGNVFELHAVVVNEKGELQGLIKDSDGKVTDNTDPILKGAVADSYRKDGNTVGHKTGTIYKVSADGKKLFDGDSMAVAYQRAQLSAGKTGTDVATFAAGTLEFYLKVGNDYVFGTTKDKPGNTIPMTVKLAIPTSPAGTSDAALQSRWVKVVIANGVPTATLEKTIDEPVNVTLADIRLSISSKSETDIESMAGVDIKTTDKAAANAKYTITVKGLSDSQNGLKVQLAGSKIQPIQDGKTFELGDYWYGGPADKIGATEQENTTLCQTIEKGSVSWSFYGEKPGYDANTSPAIKIYKFGKENKDKVFFLSDGLGNFFFPEYTYGKDVELTIDVSKLDAKSVTQADPVVAPAEIKINAIYVANLAAATASSDYYLTASDDGTPSRVFLKDNEKNGTLKELLEKWSPADAAVFATAEKTLGYTFPEIISVKPAQTTFVLGFRAVPSKADPNDATKTVFDWDNDSAFETPVLLTENFATDKLYTMYADAVTGNIALIETAKVKFDALTSVSYTVKTLKITGWTKAWEPNLIGVLNSWSGDIPMTAVAGEKGVYTIDLSSYSINPGDNFKFRKTGDWDNTVGGYIGTDGNIEWPKIFTKTTAPLAIDVTCVIDNVGKVTNPVSWAKAN